jgi:hypothetical protein
MSNDTDRSDDKIRDEHAVFVIGMIDYVVELKYVLKLREAALALCRVLRYAHRSVHVSNMASKQGSGPSPLQRWTGREGNPFGIDPMPYT